MYTKTPRDPLGRFIPLSSLYAAPTPVLQPGGSGAGIQAAVHLAALGLHEAWANRAGIRQAFRDAKVGRRHRLAGRRQRWIKCV